MRFDPQSNMLGLEDQEQIVQAPGLAGKSRPGRRAVGGVAAAAMVAVALGAVAIWHQARPAGAVEFTGASTLGARPTRSMAPTHENDHPLAAPDNVENPSHALSGGLWESGERDHFEEGRRLQAHGRHAAAVPHLLEAVRVTPDHAQAHYKLGMAYVMTGDVHAAQDECALLQQLEPNLANLLTNLIRSRL